MADSSEDRIEVAEDPGVAADTTQENVDAAAAAAPLQETMADVPTPAAEGASNTMFELTPDLAAGATLGAPPSPNPGRVSASTSVHSTKSARSTQVEEVAKLAELEKKLIADEDEDTPLVENGAEGAEKVSTARLFQYADHFDRVMIFWGCFFGAGHGVFLPCVMLIFGDTITLLSGNQGGLAAAGRLNGSNATLNSTNATLPNPLDGLVEQMGRQAIIYCGLAGGVLIATYFQIVAWGTVGERLTRRIRKNFFAAILNQDVSWFDTHKTGELSSRMSDDLVKVYIGIGDKNGIFCQWMATCVTGLTIAFVKGWKLSLIVLFGGGPFLIASGVFVSKLIANIGSQEQDSYAKAGAVAGEVLSSVRTVVAFGGEQQEAERYETELETARRFGVRKGFVSGFGFSMTYFMMFCVYGLAFYTGTLFVWNGELLPGEMVTAFFTVVFACFALGHASPSIQANAEARGAAVAIYNIIDNVPVINTSSGKGKQPEKLDGNFLFEDVHFTYPSRPDVKILNGLNLEIKSGTTTALVGPSGCGKSTCIQLLQRFYDVDSGGVTLDGVDLRDINVEWLRSQIGIVGQEPVLFHTTIAENIAYGSLGEASRDDIVEAAKQANAHTFITGFPDGYDTLVGERGAQMSGGQKQRIAIARALVRNPRILLLDEATSALDTESESVVQAALEKACTGRTTVIIAHRLTTVRNADRIVAIKDGVVEEQGNHHELMEKKGLYHALVSLQSAVGGDDATKADNSEQKTAFVSQKSTVSVGNKSLGSKKDAEDEKEEEEEEEEEEDLPEINTRRLLSYNKPEFGTMAVGAFGALCFGCVFPSFGVIFANVLSVFELLGDPANKDEYFRRAHFWSGMFAVLGVASFGVLLAQFYFFGHSGSALTKRMRSIAFRAILRQNIGFFDEKSHSTGALTTRLSADAALIQGATGQKIGSVFQLFSTMVSAIVISMLASWQMTLLILAVIPLVAAAGAANTRALAGHGSTSKTEHLEAGKIAVELIENVRTVVSLGMEKRSVDRYMAILEPAYQKHKRTRHFQALTTGMSEATFFLVYAITFAFGAFLIEERLATFTDVFTVFGAMIFGAFSLGQSAAFAPDMSKAGTAAARIFQLVDSVPTIDSYSQEGEQPESVSGDIELKGISFHYPTRPDVQVLSGTTITAKAGQTVALVGQSGCGKSTSVSLLERFYDPLEGTVHVDGKDIKELNLGWLRRQIGIVQQEPILFDSSIGDNIAYGALERMVTIEEIHEVAKKSNIHSFIMGLPNGYDTNVGSKGTQLSGGQKQRIAIARALIRSPKILLLDEATSALDTESERVVQEALDVARQGRTCIVIAHRLSTIHNSDKIIVLGGGKILEQGTHSELMALSGAYCKLNSAQEGNQAATLS